MTSALVKTTLLSIAMLTASAGAAQAHSSFSIGLSVPFGGGYAPYYQPAPVYYAPPPVYYYPQRPLYYRTQFVPSYYPSYGTSFYYSNAGGYRGRGWDQDDRRGWRGNRGNEHYDDGDGRRR